MERVRIKEEDFVPESAGLMKFKPADPQKNGDQLATDLRRSRKKSLISSKRGLFGNQTPRERSVSPMFNDLQVRGNVAKDGTVVDKNDISEESKAHTGAGVASTGDILSRQVQVREDSAKAEKTECGAGVQ
jgi:hypothetical protein